MKFKCILCSWTNYEQICPRIRDGHYKVLKCSHCLHLQIFPLPNRDEEKIFYDNDIQTKLIYKKIKLHQIQKRCEADTLRRTKKVKKLLKKNAQVLDIGCGYGFFVKSLNENGCNCIGLEISKERRVIAEKITQTSIWSHKINSKNTKIKFNAITMFHVLEHVLDPIKLCQNLRSCLKPKGTLIIEVPNANDYMLIMNKQYFNFFWQRAHISYFSPQTISIVLKKAGYTNLNIIGIQRYSFENALNWLKYGKPQLKLPIYNTRSQLNWLEELYKKHLEKKLISDTLWIEARI